MNEAVLHHYESLGENFEDFKCSPHNIVVGAHVQFLKEIFQCSPHHKVVDLGAGNCLFAKSYVDIENLDSPLLCVEPVAGMLKHGEGDKRLTTLCDDALTFTAKSDVSYDRIVIRGAIHHFGNNILPTVFKNICNQLNSGGIFVIIRMHGVENLPWFQKLKDVFNSHDPTHLADETILKLLEDAGFDSYEKVLKSSNHSISKENLWLSFRKHYVSTLSKVTDEDIENGILELKEKHKSESEIHYIEDFDFFIAKKI